MENTANSGIQDLRNGYYSIGEFEGKERFVRFDLNAFAEMEKLFGSMEAANEALTKGSMRDVRTVLWLGLIHDQAILDEVTGEPIKYTLTQYEVGRWLTPDNMKDVMEKLNKAISGSLPDEQKDGTSPTALQAEADRKEAELTSVTPFPKSQLPE